MCVLYIYNNVYYSGVVVQGFGHAGCYIFIQKILKHFWVLISKIQIYGCKTEDIDKEYPHPEDDDNFFFI